MEYVRFTKRDEVTGEWRKLHSEEFNDHYPHPILFLGLNLKE